jgi:hypothetical protein
MRPDNCNANNDNDCEPSCGNGVVEEGEICDTGIERVKELARRAATTAFLHHRHAQGEGCSPCVNTAITQCNDDDGCCADGCNANNDSDCDLNA